MKTLIKNNVKGLFFLLPMLVLLFSTMKVRAEEEKYYPKYRENEYIVVRGEMILENCFLKKSVIKGSKGGTVTFDLDNDRIIFDNFKDEYAGSGGPDEYDGYFRIRFYVSPKKSMEIILKGDNEIVLSNKKCIARALQLDTFANIKGPGTLTINGLVQCCGTMTVRDCDITINSSRAGMDVEYLELYNSDVECTTTSMDAWQNAFTLGHLVMENSTLRGVSKRAYICAPWILAEGLSEYPNLEYVFTGKTGEIFVDDDGNMLYPVKYEFNMMKYFVFTKDVEAYKEYKPANIALTVNIASPARLNQRKAVEQVKEKIAAIGVVTVESGEKIKAARNAYDNLEQNIRYKVKNIDVLEKAEKAYREINQKEADKVIAMIAGLETITSESGPKMEAVERAYDSLTADQKNLVSNYKDMEKARLKFQEAVDQRGQDEWLREQESANEGIRGLARREFSKLQVSSKAKEVGVKKAVSNKKGTLTLEWKKEKKCSGYQIVCSRKKDFKSKDTITILINNKKQTSYTFKKLTSKKSYFVKIRSYKVVNKEKQYGKWSKVKKVKVK